MKQGFWAHQVVEYLLGLAAIATGAQSERPLMPCLAGVLLLLNAATADGPLAAFHLVPRRFHRLTDDILVVVLILLAVLGGKHVDTNGRFVLVGLALVLAFIVWKTDYSTKQKKVRGAEVDRSEQVGRTAGRVAGNAVTAWKHRKPS